MNSLPGNRRTDRRPQRVVMAFGTRPEAIKMAPVYRALQSFPGIEPVVLLTGQHEEQLRQALDFFGIPAAHNLSVMTERQELTDLAARILPHAARSFRALEADYVLVHGDTLTTFVCAWAAFLERLPVGHVEAGLRSANLAEPFPEEANRRLTGVIADVHLAPTAAARHNLLREGVDPDRIVVTGQTGIDAILEAARLGTYPGELPPSPYVVITLHRRENWPHLRVLCQALAYLARAHPHVTFIYPIHMNPIVRERVYPVLDGICNVWLIEPLEYGAMAVLLRESTLIVTDSGGLQEEGAALGVPVVVVRNVTERPEGVDSGILRLAGTDPQRLIEVVGELLASESERRRMQAAVNPYGDGQAAVRVAQAVAWRLGLAERPDDWSPTTVQSLG